MSNAFCGIGNIPKGKKRGSMKECVEANQIRYYGLKKVDQKLIDSINSKKKIDNAGTKSATTQFRKLTVELLGLRGKVKNVKGKMQAAKDKKTKDECLKELDQIEKQKNKIKLDIQNVQKKMGSKKQSRLSRSSSKKTKSRKSRSRKSRSRKSGSRK